MKLTLPLLTICIILTGQLHAQDILLAGTSRGLFKIGQSSAQNIWNGADVRKIIRNGNAWFFLTGSGILRSTDLAVFEERNTGLPIKVIKDYVDGKKDFHREIQELKDLEVHPLNANILVTATKDAVYLTRDGGLTWQNLGLSAVTAGVKAVAVLDLPDSTGQMQLTVLMSHPIYGFSWKRPDVRGGAWQDLNTGLASVPSIRWADEIADISVVMNGAVPNIFASQTFMGRVYRLDWAKRAFTPLWSGPNHLDTVESLANTGKTLLSVSPSGIREITLPAADSDASTPAIPGNTAAIAPDTVNAAAKAAMGIPTLNPAAQTPAVAADWLRALNTAPGNLLSAWIPAVRTAGRGNLAFNELWLLSPGNPASQWTMTAAGKKGNYIPVHQAGTPAGLDGHLKTLRDNALNMLVIDMKDDYGTIRYNARDPLVLRKGNIRPTIDVEAFIAKAKAQGIYTVARIVVFKDRSLALREGGRYAIWDRRENKAWQGYRLVPKAIEAASESGTAPAEQVRQYYDEHWVDPYSEEVWEYNTAVAKELIARGFDEIQFDYIRFPTDGTNLDNASYRWQDPGMDKESALMSFLAYARREIQAPVSIDIYGANGWYRTGSRTGQDVETIARYVDVICPMFYPSHFEQVFLAQDPPEERPYRIYYYGSYRNLIIARNHVLVRPWTQAFYIGVSYDRKYYNADYVQRQIFGIRDSINQGYTHWNNSGRYGDIRPDIFMNAPYPWTSPEAAAYLFKPAFGGR